MYKIQWSTKSPQTAPLAAGSNLLFLVVPENFAGRLIGKKGANVQDHQFSMGIRKDPGWWLEDDWT